MRRVAPFLVALFGLVPISVSAEETPAEGAAAEETPAAAEETPAAETPAAEGAAYPRIRLVHVSEAGRASGQGGPTRP